MKKYLRLLRVRHYIKNILVFMPLIFSKQLFTNNFYIILIGFLAFCLLSSTIYIINDIADYQVDQKTQNKQKEPIANGSITRKKGFYIALILGVMAFILNYLTNSPLSYLYFTMYLILNLFYSFVGKKIPYFELLIMSSFYLLRVGYGAVILNIRVSIVLFLTVLFGSLYITIMKRIAEIRNGKYRQVFLVYTEKKLRYIGQLALLAMLLSYISWMITQKIKLLFVTLVLLLFIFTKYNRKVRVSTDGNPVEIIFSDPILMTLSLQYALTIVILIEMPL